MMRVINLPAIHRQVTLRAYLMAIRTAKANPEQEFKYGLTCWWPCTGAEIMRQFMEGVHDRINQGIRYADRGRQI